MAVNTEEKRFTELGLKPETFKTYLRCTKIDLGWNGLSCL